MLIKYQCEWLGINFKYFNNKIIKLKKEHLTEVKNKNRKIDNH